MTTNYFPKDFLWGAATSAYQVEGAADTHGKKKSIADVLTEQSQVFADSSVSVDHYHRYEEDVRLMAELGLNSYRFSINWSRIFPDGSGEVNQEGVDFYNHLIDALVKYNIEPIATIYHFDLPLALHERYGGWQSREVLNDFIAYCKFVYTAFGDRVKYWLTINEQSVILQYSLKKNLIDPSTPNAEQIKYQINHHLHLAHAHAVNIGHELVKGSMIGPALGYNPIYPLDSHPDNVIAAMNAQDLRNQMFLDVYCKGEYTKSAWNYLERNGLAPKVEPEDWALLKSAKSDYLAINYYMSNTAKAPAPDAVRVSGATNLLGKKGHFKYQIEPGFFEMTKNPNVETTEWDWEIDPVGLRFALRDIYTRYNLPMMITENGIGLYDKVEEDGSINDDDRIDYLRKHLQQCNLALQDGVELLGYYPWSFIDLLSTSNGFAKRYGFVHVNRDDNDVKDLKRTPKKSFGWYKRVIESGGAEL